MENNKFSYDWWLESTSLEYHAWWDGLFTESELDAISNLYHPSKFQQGRVGEKGVDKFEVETRNSNVWFLPTDNNEWIFSKFVDVVKTVNENFFKFKLNRIETLQYTVYNHNQFYGKHLDLQQKSPPDCFRKLSFSMQISHPHEYEGGILQIHTSDKPVNIEKRRGLITFFPSYILHEVTPVLSGTRKSLVGWVSGPKWV